MEFSFGKEKLLLETATFLTMSLARQRRHPRFQLQEKRQHREQALLRRRKRQLRKLQRPHSLSGAMSRIRIVLHSKIQDGGFAGKMVILACFLHVEKNSA